MTSCAPWSLASRFQAKWIGVGFDACLLEAFGVLERFEDCRPRWWCPWRGLIYLGRGRRRP